MNQPSCLYGFFTYGKELFDSYQAPQLNVLAVNDGEILEQEFKKRLDKFIKGNYLNSEQQDIKSRIYDSMISLNLEYRTK